MHELCRSLDGLPLAIELAAARTRTLSIEQIARRLDDRFGVLSDPTSRKPERRRALKATIGWSYELLFPDDQRGLWALATFAGGASLPAVESVLDALAVPPSAAIDVVGRLASRSLVIVDDGGAAAPRYRLLDSIRAFALEALADAGLTDRARDAHAAWFAAAAASSTEGVRSARQAEHLAFARTERANIDAALAWSAAHEPQRALDIVNGFGWAWIVLGDSRGAQRILAALAAAGAAAPVRDRAGALLLAGWIEASTGHLEPARRHVAAAGELADASDDADLQARCCYHLAYVVSHHGEWEHALELTGAQPGALRRAGPALGPGGERALRRQGRDLGRRPHARRRGPRPGRSTGCAPSTTRGCTSAATPCSASWPASSIGSTRPSTTSAGRRRRRGGSASSRRRPTRSRASGVRSARPGTTPPERRRWSAGSRRPRRPATCVSRRSGASTSAACCGRSDGSPRPGRRSKPRRPGTARPAAASRPRSATACSRRSTRPTACPGRSSGSSPLLEGARRSGDAPVEVFALDALARMAADAGDEATARDRCEAADRRMESASHFITERDRTDARSLRQTA